MSKNSDPSGQWEDFVQGDDSKRSKKRSFILPIAIFVLLFTSTGLCVLILNTGSESNPSENLPNSEISVSAASPSTSGKMTSAANSKSSSSTEARKSTTERSGSGESKNRKKASESEQDDSKESGDKEKSTSSDGMFSGNNLPDIIDETFPEDAAVVADYCEQGWLKIGVVETDATQVYHLIDGSWELYSPHGSAFPSALPCYDKSILKEDGVPGDLQELLTKCEIDEYKDFTKYVAVGPTTTGFARNVFQEFTYQYSLDGETEQVLTGVYSPTTGQYYEMHCSGDKAVTCTGGNNAVVKIW